MNEFVDQCRHEWKRLGVPRAAADEMAVELAADLEHGTSEEVLGTDALDAPSFARAWATERGVVRPRRRSRIPAVLAALALVPTIIGAELVLTSDDHVEAALPPSGDTVIWIAPAPSPNKRTAIAATIAAQAQVEAAHRQAVVLKAAAGSVAAPGDDSNTLGNVLLVVGLALLVPSTLLWSARVALGR